MSATVETSKVSWRKRRSQEEAADLQIEMKKPRYYYYRLASESSRNSEEETESIYSIQDQETDFVKDTTDTDSQSGSDAEEYEVEIEYEVASLSESDHAFIENSTTDSDAKSMDHAMFAAAIGAMCDSSLEKWITDCEESDNSSLDDSAVTRLDFSTCVQCKSPNDNPLYSYCEKCFQDRKKFYPPRPRGNRKSKKKPNDQPVKLATLRSCLSGLSSQDSGVGSSQECPPLDLQQIVVPDKHLKPGTSDVSPLCELKESTSKDTNRQLRTKRRFSESSLSDYDIKRPKRSQKFDSRKDISVTLTSDKSCNDQTLSLSQTSNVSEKSTETCSSQNSTEASSFSQNSTVSQVSERSLSLRSAHAKSLSHNSDSSGVSTSSGYASGCCPTKLTELCIMCNSAPKDSIFVHTNIGHQCCCYKCAKRTLHTIKRCPICNRSVSKVIRIIQS